MNEKVGGLIFGAEFHYLDHLAPLCALKNIPLLVTNRKVEKQAQTFYPDLEVSYFEEGTAPPQIAHQYDTLITCMPRLLFDRIFLLAQGALQKRVKTIWCPHGNSDKGRTSSFMEPLADEEHLLVYGERMENFLRDKGVNVPMTRVGNYRLTYFEKHRDFYETLFPKRKEKTYLYAPTWQDQEKNSSFPHLWSHLQDAKLLVKLHPHLYRQYPDEINQLRDKVELIEDFPPIYPILAKCDLLICDVSSIGYDFLPFEKPLLLLSDKASSDPSCALAQAGAQLHSSQYADLFSFAEELTPKSSPLLEETFAPTCCDLESMLA